MARPTLDEILSGLNNWEVEVNTNFGLLVGGAFPIYRVATVGALPAAASFEHCLVVVQSSPPALMVSNGSSWVNVAASSKLDDLAAPDDNTDLDASTSVHGLLRKLTGASYHFLRADGTWANPHNRTVNDQTGTTYTLALTDEYSYVRASNASAITVTVPPDSSLVFAVGAEIPVIQVGVGQVTVAAGSGVTVNTPETLKVRAQYSTVTLRKVATDEWDISGDLEDAP